MAIAALTQRLAEQVLALSQAPLPAPVLSQARVLLADTLLVAAAGQATALAASLGAVVAPSQGPSHAWFVPGRAPMAACDAAFLNALHAALPGYASINHKAHADLVCLPAAWAMGEQCGATPAAVLQAFVLASEVVGRLSHLASARSAGWSHTAIYGGLGAALAAGLLLGLAAEPLAHALGLALGQAAGTQQASLEGATGRRLLPAFAARHGVFAAQLAAAGATAARQAFEGRFGLRALYEAGDDKALLAGLGERWYLLETSLKPYPVSACSQAAVQAVLHLLAQQQLAEADLLEVVAYVSPFMFRYVGAEFSLTGDLDMLAQFNLRYHLASVLLRGPLRLAHLTPAALAEPEVARVLAKVHLRVDPRNTADFAPVTVAATLRDGRVLSYTQARLPGSRPSPLSAAGLAHKATSCAELAGLDGSELLARLLRVDTFGHLGEVLPGLTS